MAERGEIHSGRRRLAPGACGEGGSETRPPFGARRFASPSWPERLSRSFEGTLRHARRRSQRPAPPVPRRPRMLPCRSLASISPFGAAAVAGRAAARRRAPRTEPGATRARTGRRAGFMAGGAERDAPAEARERRLINQLAGAGGAPGPPRAGHAARFGSAIGRAFGMDQLQPPYHFIFYVTLGI